VAEPTPKASLNPLAFFVFSPLRLPTRARYTQEAHDSVGRIYLTGKDQTIQAPSLGLFYVPTKVNMNDLPVLNFRAFIDADGETLTTDSRKVAAAFGKRHDRVLRAIDVLMQNLHGEHRTMFGDMLIPVDIGNGAIRHDRAFTITRDGFSLLAMGFTGVKALSYKLAYIDAFNAMDAYIKNQRVGLTYQCAAKELECKNSHERGSFHGRGLNKRKQEKPIPESELAALQKLVQPSLLN